MLHNCWARETGSDEILVGDEELASYCAQHGIHLDPLGRDVVTERIRAAKSAAAAQAYVEELRRKSTVTTVTQK